MSDTWNPSETQVTQHPGSTQHDYKTCAALTLINSLCLAVTKAQCRRLQHWKWNSISLCLFIKIQVVGRRNCGAARRYINACNLHRIADPFWNVPTRKLQTVEETQSFDQD